MDKFDSTPSFYNTEESFEKYLGRTSYYLNLQKAVLKLIMYTEPNSVLDMGCGLGQTTFLINHKTDVSDIKAIDNREKVISKCKEKNEHKNITFENKDMREYVGNIDSEFIFLLYSFHHIPDPNENKIQFLKQAYENMDDGSYMCIAEAFLPENKTITELWSERSIEGYASTFWNSLSGIDEESIKQSQEIGNFCREKELLAGTNVYQRKEEYLIDLPWLSNKCQEIGFEIILIEPVNAFNDSVVLLQK